MFLLENIAHIFCWIGGKTLFKFFLHFQVTGKEKSGVVYVEVVLPKQK